MSKPEIYEGFKFYRPQEGLEFDEDWRSEFLDTYEEYWLNPPAEVAVSLLLREEARRFILQRVKRISPAQLLEQTYTQRPFLMNSHIEVKRQSIDYDLPNPLGHRQISVYVKDETGRLEEEREYLISKLGKLAGTSLLLPKFEPRMEVGYAPPETSDEPLEYISQRIPHKIGLQAVTTDPITKRAKQHRRWVEEKRFN
jgi:hypothetical protein